MCLPYVLCSSIPSIVFFFLNVSCHCDVTQNFKNIYRDKCFYFFFNESGLPVLRKVSPHQSDITIFKKYSSKFLICIFYIFNSPGIYF